MDGIRKYALGAATAFMLAAVPIASNAGVIQLGFMLDRSGSIGATNWNTIVDGLSGAVGSLIPFGGPDTYEVSVVSFGASASADVSRVSVTDAASRTALANSIFDLGNGRANDVYIGGLTNYNAAFTTMTAVLGPTIAGADASYVNFATDGDPTTGGTGIAQRNTLLGSGVDNISIEAIGSSVDAANLQNNFCFPQPCDITSPFNFPTQGFYIGVADAAGYAAAIGNKIRIVTQVPEPSTVLMLGLGLAGLAFGARRRSSS